MDISIDTVTVRRLTVSMTVDDWQKILDDEGGLLDDFLQELHLTLHPKDREKHRLPGKGAAGKTGKRGKRKTSSLGLKDVAADPAAKGLIKCTRPGCSWQGLSERGLKVHLGMAHGSASSAEATTADA